MVNIIATSSGFPSPWRGVFSAGALVALC